MTVILEKQETQEQQTHTPHEQVVMSHIVIGPDGQARIACTGYKVRLMAGWHRFRGETPEQMQMGHPDLTMAQVYSVLAYYYDHKEEMDAEMDQRNAMAEKMRYTRNWRKNRIRTSKSRPIHLECSILHGREH